MRCGISDEDAAFIAGTYDLVSLEKCFGVGGPGPHNYTISNFIWTARQIKRQPGGNRTKVLFYWSSHTAYTDCYEDVASGLMMAHPEWWLRRANGSAYSHHAKRPIIDFTVKAAADWWVSVLTYVYQHADEAMDGVFIDGASDWASNLPREDFSDERIAELNAAHRVAMRRASQALHKLSPSLQMIGNGASIELLKDGTLDGTCVEHFGAFEWATSVSGVPRAKIVSRVLDSLHELAALGKVVLVKGWVGPETTPIDDLGPTWPRKFVDPKTDKGLKRNPQGISRAASDLLDYALASFLCTAGPSFMFSYTWWYDVYDGVVPGGDAPKKWYPQLRQPVGQAQGPARLEDGHRCSRSFENAEVAVDLLDYGSAKITWKAAAGDSEGNSVSA